MKTGVIVYMAGDEPQGFCPEIKNVPAMLDFKADRVAWISRHSGYHDIHDADFALSAKGMDRIICLMGEFTDTGHVSLTGRALRLRG
ncbi:MAG: hypothetical protein KKD44_07650 [Proteobacteria bacterium]|nr:hypothetical protein [Pseudomonadota bacterium]